MRKRPRIVFLTFTLLTLRSTQLFVITDFPNFTFNGQNHVRPEINIQIYEKHLINSHIKKQMKNTKLT